MNSISGRLRVTRAEPTATVGEANVDGGEQRLADGMTVALSEESGARLAGVVSTLLSTVDCGGLGRAVAGSGGATEVATSDQA